MAEDAARRFSRGCFLDVVSYPPVLYEHNSRAGAGISVRVQEMNVAKGYDYVGTQLGVPPSCAGGYTLSIPVFWWVDYVEREFSLGNLVQVVNVTSNGVTTISKQGLSTTR